MAGATVTYKAVIAQIDDLDLDCSLSERHAGDVEVTDHPVEQGANIADHARAKPEVITIEGMVTNSPLIDGSLIDTAAAVTRAGAALDKLRKLKDTGTLVTVFTSIRQYENMVITSLEVPRDVKTGNVLRFTATLKQVRVVQNKTVAIKTNLSAAKSKQNLGKKQPTKADDSTSQSVLKALSDAAGLTGP